MTSTLGTIVILCFILEIFDQVVWQLELCSNIVNRLEEPLSEGIDDRDSNELRECL